jgi:hypothetical protein
MNTTEHTCSSAGASEETLRDVKSRFSIVIVVAILLSTAIASLYQLLTSSPKLSDLGYLGMFIPAMYILAYASFEAAKRWMPAFYMMITRRAVLLGLALYVFPIVFIALYQNGVQLSFGMKVLLQISIWATPLAALGTLLTVLTGWAMGCKKCMACSAEATEVK